MTLKVVVLNKRTDRIPPGAVYVGRPSLFGNPYSHLPDTKAQFRVATREEAVSAYADHAERMMATSPEFRQAIEKLRRRQVVHLVCWCAPLSCHAEVIAGLLLDGVSAGSVSVEAFFGEHQFLSNFCVFPFVWKEILWASAEHAFQAAKTFNAAEMRRIRSAGLPRDAKTIGNNPRLTTMRPDWDEVKDRKMRSILVAKFHVPELRRKLAATGDALLVEGNNWCDIYWGVCHCPRHGGRGQNRLGLALMDVRRVL